MRNSFVSYAEMFPVITAEYLDIFIIKSDAVVLGAYSTGTVPKIILPSISMAKEKLKPLFSIRQIRTNKWTYDWGGEVLPGLYEPEVEAIKAGLVPLQRNLSTREEVLYELKKICDENENYYDIIERARKRFSSEAFNKRLDVVKIKYCG